EQLFNTVMKTVGEPAWTGPGPHFERLVIEIDHDGQDERLPVGHERLDTAEALHEEIYFSLLELFRLQAELPEGSRALQPGQIVPLVRNVPGGENSVEIRLDPHVEPLQNTAGRVWSASGLDTLEESI